VYRDNWNIQLTKTGFTNAAGHCLVMRTVFNGKPVALVVMDAFGKYTHFADASRLRTWIETGKVQPVPAAALTYKSRKRNRWRRRRTMSNGNARLPFL
jgi:D-alanyl-D-alanine endopeptidase (penicillin-binding protein 7)